MAGRIVYNMSVSLDGRVATADGSLDWVTVDDEAHGLFNDEARSMSAFLLGRRTYELLQAYWPAADQDPLAPAVIIDFARIWREKPKFVFSRSLAALDDITAALVNVVSRESIDRIKRATGGDLSVGGPTLASAFIELGLIDEYLLYVNTVVLGAGTPYFPPASEPVNLGLRAVSTLRSGVVRLSYST